MQKREPQKYGQYKDGMPGGGQNPLGARAIYLYEGKKDTHLRIHGTIAPETIGTNSSNGCFRMVNEHVMDLYGRVQDRHQGRRSLDTSASGCDRGPACAGPFLCRATRNPQTGKTARRGFFRWRNRSGGVKR